MAVLFSGHCPQYLGMVSKHTDQLTLEPGDPIPGTENENPFMVRGKDFFEHLLRFTQIADSCINKYEYC